MARKSPKNTYPVKTLDEANAALERLAALQRSLTAEELAMNEKIDAIKAKFEQKAEGLQQQIKELENGLQAFCEFNKASLFEKKRSVELAFGVIGFRKASKLAPTPKTTWAMVVAIMEKIGFKSGIRVKKTANKDVLSGWSDEKLAKVKVTRKQMDNFYYETKEEGLQGQGSVF